MTDKLGPTGDFPDGKLNPQDEGGLQMAIHTEGHVVRIDFGSPVAWVAFEPPIARTLAAALLKAADQADRHPEVGHG